MYCTHRNTYNANLDKLWIQLVLSLPLLPLNCFLVKFFDGFDVSFAFVAVLRHLDLVSGLFVGLLPPVGSELLGGVVSNTRRVEFQAGSDGLSDASAVLAQTLTYEYKLLLNTTWNMYVRSYRKKKYTTVELNISIRIHFRENLRVPAERP